MTKEKIALVIPFWDIEDQPERCENLKYSYDSITRYSDYHNSNTSNKFIIDVLLINLGESINNEYPQALHIPHSGLEYKFEKPTRMNSAFQYLYEKLNYKWVGMCDPDLILFESYYNSMMKSIESHLVHNTMLTYGFTRTKPELRNYLDLTKSNTEYLSDHNLIKESDQYTEWWGLCGGMFFMNLMKFITIGGFNENYRVYGMDDVDFTQRFQLHENKVLIFNDVRLHHLYHQRVISSISESHLDRYEYELKYWRIHREKFKTEILKPHSDRIIYNHVTPRFNRYSRLENINSNQQEFNYNIGKHPIESLPLNFQYQIGYKLNTEFHYNINNGN